MPQLDGTWQLSSPAWRRSRLSPPLKQVQPGQSRIRTAVIDFWRRPQQKHYRLDGASLNDYANGGPGSVLGGNLGVDAIQESLVLTSNYSPNMERPPGAS